MSQSRILVVEDDQGLREALIDTLELAGYVCQQVESGEEALLALNQHHYDMVISDIQMPGIGGLELLNSIRRSYAGLPVLLMTAYARIDDAVKAMRCGAIDYLAKPFSPEVLLNQVGRYVPSEKAATHQPIYADPKSAELFVLASKVAATDATVMITGPSGAGKEVLARYIHEQSSRKDQPFVAINCAAIPENMLEATLFGYEKGAFTGAVQACPGKFEQAQGGTLLLDEISEMELNLQAKLLRVLQEKEVERLGGRKSIVLDVRVLATSNRDLKQCVDDGDFREDLYYRLNVFPLRWIPLRERPGDIAVLAEHLLTQYAMEQQVQRPALSAQAINALESYHWPGNVRELSNVMQRALILAGNETIETTHLIFEEALRGGPVEPTAPPKVSMASMQAVLNDDDNEFRLGGELRQQEQQIILEALERFRGSRKDVAEALGISPRTLRYKIAKMRDSGIELPC